MRQKCSKEDMKKFFKKYDQTNPILRKHWKRALLAMMEGTRERRYSFAKKRDLRLIFHPLAQHSDTIFQKEIQELIQRGVSIMKESKDPFHDFHHIKRCIKYAKLFFTMYGRKHNLDWGSLVLAIAWHDVSRVKGLDIDYQRRWWKYLEYLPLAIEVSILKNGINDAEQSIELFMNEAQNISSIIQQQVIQGIQGTSPQRNAEQSFYAKIVGDVDMLDLYTIGRFESGLRNVFAKKMASERFFNKSILLGSLLLSSQRSMLKTKLGKILFKKFLHLSLIFIGRQYPEDKKLFKVQGN